MRYFTADDQYVVVLQKGELLHECLRDFMLQTGTMTAWIQGLGASIELEIGYYDLELQTYKWKQFTGPYEITALQGNVVRDAQNMPVFHLHGSFSDNECKGIGGHINRLVVGGTCEVLVRPVKTRVTRVKDEGTGLHLLCAVPESELA